MPYLIMDKQAKNYRVFSCSDNITIGRDDDNDIVLHDQDNSAISRNHASIKKKNGRYILYDTSINGTFVNDDPVKEYPLVDGARFQIIHYGFTFVENTVMEHRESPSCVDRKQQSLPSNQENNDVSQTLFVNSTTALLQRKLKLKKELRQAGIIAENDAMLSLFMDMKEIVRINVPILILGEPGTGKEKVAQSLHTLSKSKGAFVPLNCPSIPEGIFESELFGSVKGAFSDAADKPGKLELADNGTFFLDEVGDMALPLQPKLLRFLEDSKITRLGDTRTKTVNVRIVSATNQDLKTMMQEKRFREDLYQRLACIKLQIPPLRDRKEDILPMSNYFLSKFSAEHNLKPLQLTDDAQKILLRYPWPGNVRELNNVLLSCAVRCRGGAISADQLSAASDEMQARVEVIDNSIMPLEDVEKKHIKKALQQAEGNKLKAAKMLGISRDTLYNKIKKYNI